MSRTLLAGVCAVRAVMTKSQCNEKRGNKCRESIVRSSQVSRKAPTDVLQHGDAQGTLEIDWSGGALTERLVFGRLHKVATLANYL